MVSSLMKWVVSQHRGVHVELPLQREDEVVDVGIHGEVIGERMLSYDGGYRQDWCTMCEIEGSCHGLCQEGVQEGGKSVVECTSVDWKVSRTGWFGCDDPGWRW